MPRDLPILALSVRQPWAWAIIHGGKDIENRTHGSIKSGQMRPGQICIHAATGLTEEEYRWSVYKLQQVGVTPPRPDDLVRGAIIGTVEVTDIVTKSDSPWFGGPCGLVLRDPKGVDPIAAPGALGYLEWAPSGAVVSPRPWMMRYDRANGDDRTRDLFPDLNQSFATPPPRPYPKSKPAD
ncbi:hypothetical protein [Actibacterium sp. 188UL27-1]|uniref:hypothetical protein n=1 Tax=Actibacterium sp. 188UL27-1 TaxID=2786961 RepID=UPI00195637CA|nr:hypothetical protein [Actibacterium sp. 188UL27-1]MBM7068299.1 hypothetical protein [Actibacterium sp. 188UL27-1]